LSLKTLLFSMALLLAPAAYAATEESLTIYFIDVEGGQSTLIVTPKHHALLVDTGWAGNSASRILAAAHDAGLKQIDDLMITHFHSDHDGGVPELSRLIPILTFIDHDTPSAEAQKTSQETADAFKAYAAVRAKGKHVSAALGKQLPLEDLDAVVVSNAGSALTSPLPNAGAANGACQDHPVAPRDPDENPRSTGILVRYGKFRFLDVGDLTGQPLFDLACPKSRIGPVDVYLVAHHGGPDVDVPATFAAFKPRVAIMNNGMKKGGAQTTYQALHAVSGLEDVWQLHASADAGEANFAADRIANLDESTAHWIKVVAKKDGSFRVFNQRINSSKNYAPR